MSSLAELAELPTHGFARLLVAGGIEVKWHDCQERCMPLRTTKPSFPRPTSSRSLLSCFAFVECFFDEDCESQCCSSFLDVAQCLGTSPRTQSPERCHTTPNTYFLLQPRQKRFEPPGVRGSDCSCRRSGLLTTLCDIEDW